MLKAVISTLSTGLYAVYKAESNTNDSLLNYNGTPYGGLTYTAGKSGNAFTFNGIDAFVSLPDNSLNFTGTFSYSFWIKSSNTTDYTIIVGNIQNARTPYSFVHGYQYWLATGKIQLDYRDGNNSTNFTQTTPTTVADGSWKHIVITFNPSNVTTGNKIYINGSLDISGITPSTGGTSLPIGYSSPMKPCIGARNVSGSAITFLSSGTNIDEMNTWNKELTSTEVTELYNAGVGKFYPY